ncbi:hypothetical protein Trydic_g5173 [Trypoxylus dichotomus]
MITAGSKFEKYGHKCQIPHVPPELWMFEKGGNFYVRLRNLIVRLRMATSQHAGGWRYLPSHASIMREHKKHLMNLYIVHPFSKFRIYWEMLMTLTFGLQFVVIPLELAIYYTSILENVRGAWNFVRISLDFVCLADVVLNFFTGYLQTMTKEIILNPSKIMRKYLKSLFFPDVISSIMGYSELLTYFPLMPPLLVQILKCLPLLKLMRMVTFLKYARDLADEP